MKYNTSLKQDIQKYFDYVIIVEGKKDVSALKSLGFSKVYELHITSIPLRERIEQISKEISKKDKVCILTDFDKKGKQLYLYSKPIFQELGVKLDSSFRGLLLKAQVSHIEGLPSFLKKLEGF
jgi:5S rRNA maturation endonuclease (ribonuclease M5)